MHVFTPFSIIGRLLREGWPHDEIHDPVRDHTDQCITLANADPSAAGGSPEEAIEEQPLFITNISCASSPPSTPAIFNYQARTGDK